MRCPYCDSEVESGDPYCAMCGNRLTKSRGLSRSLRRCVTIAMLAFAAVVCIGGGILLSSRARPAPPAPTDSSPTIAQTSMPSVTPTPPPQPTAPTLWATYTNPELGVSLHYPEDWLVGEDANRRQVVFALQEDDLQMEDFPSGTGFAVVVDPAWAPGTETPDVVLDNLSGRLSSTFRHMQYGEVLSLSIDGAAAALMDIEGEFSRPGIRVRSRVAAAVAYQHAYVFFATAPLRL